MITAGSSTDLEEAISSANAYDPHDSIKAIAIHAETKTRKLDDRVFRLGLFTEHSFYLTAIATIDVCIVYLNLETRKLEN